MAMIDISFQRKSCLDDSLLLGQLPSELLQIIQHGHGGNFLDAVAIAALEPRLTAPLYVHFENVFPDICARWVQSHGDSSQSDEVVAAFARILPFSPNLSVFLEHYLQQTSGLPPNDLRRLRLISLDCDEVRRPWQDATALQRSLLAVWRLLHFDKETFRQLVRPSRVQPLLDHPNKAVRYLAILVLCKLLGASDFRLEALVKQHVGDSGPSTGDFDGETIDYAFLSLCEKQRAHEIHRRQASLRNADRASTPAFPEQRLTPFVIKYGQSLLPRPKGPGVGAARTSCLVSTPTTLANLENLAKLLQQPEPILLCGPAGCGKTSLVHQVARDLEVESSMITLHLNEQTDAKVLIGLYSTGSKPGTFQWRPGVLTRAVKEGRWVLIEDLDRAPNEIMGTLLSLIERRELLIPGRGERVRAPSSFRLFATIRASRDAEGSVALPHILGLRFWKLLQVQTTPQNELRDIIQQTNPILHRMLPVILSVYQSVTSVPQRRGTSSIARAAIDRNASLRDLLKWCRRLTAVMESVGARTGDEAVSETVQDSMFLEAVDCFAGNIQSEKARLELIRLIAKEMRISPEKVDHFVSTYTPRLEDSDSALFVGRVMLRKRRHDGRVPKSKRPFASTTHAKRLLEQISAAVRMAEPVLLVGETGIGKTTVVQQLAESLGRNLVVVNLSQQSEVGDLLGGFKPVNVRTLAIPLKEEFEDLFRLTGISASKNQKYLEQIGRSAAKGQWSRVSRLWREAPKMFSKILEDLSTRSSNDVSTREEDGQRQKRRKTESRLQTLLELKPRWELFARDLDQFDVQLSGGSSAFAFAFVEGNIVKAVRNGDWVLLDEVNLASPDTLESIVDLLQSGPIGNPSILLSETGEIERINAHPDFRIFGSMNPATDVGKRDLPPGIRSRFTEIYVGSPDRDLRDLLPIIKSYLKGTSSKDNQAADDIARLYLNTKALADEKRIVDGANEVPHFSLRTLTRVLTYVNDVSPFYGLRRALFEGFSMGFLTLLDQDSEKMVTPLIYHHIFDKHGDPQSLLSQKPKQPADGREYVRFVNKNRDRQYWLLKGERPPQERPDYIITPYVERNLLNLVRAISTRRFPILIQGPTSSGKTSMIQYLANYTGNVFVRINNHEHTDLQEYLGTYVSDSDGRLTFQDGLLVQALRKGYWIVLDELNLAPTDVLEALNRLLDDNRELLIPETQEVVRPHDRFMLFATQNPPGLYGGRKVLSRAFRNRFLELHFDDIPESELEYILQKRSINTSPPDCKRIVTVYKELSRLRQTSRVFEQKDSFATLRDLFRWALRKADYREDIANNGYMLLAERVRNQEERLAVKRIIEDVFKVKIDDKKLYDPSSSPYLATAISKIGGDGVVWTSAMRRLFVLVSAALANNEPVLLVGETGCGKTTVCQLLADVSGKQLHIVNAHRNTETGDLIGSQRPVRNRTAILDNLKEELVQALGLDGSERRSVDALLEQYRELVSQQPAAVPAELQARIKALETRSKALFEWSDGSLVHALKDGNYFLLDEISLADDSVLERLNSVLEPHRSLLLAEKGAEGSFVEAADGFQFMATMNPGGDFGKKELSPALRNRFTEIWVPPLSEQDDILEIVTSKLREPFKPFAETIVAFAHWFGKEFRPLSSTAFSIRDILVWIKFINGSGTADPAVALLHGAATVFIDTLGANPSALLAIDARTMNAQRQKCLEYLSSLVHKDLVSVYRAQPEISMDADSLRVGDFRLPRDPGLVITDDSFAMHAPTTKLNLMRVARALQIDRPILLEGSPGVGKTTLVAALANACGRPLTRINLSDQTDLMDLFGTDVPVEGAEAGVFAWRDAPFLQAMQSGGWVLLDEMNLAPQTVLEGLNACLDHRGEVYIAELDRVFKCHKDFRLFAAQNPHHQGGGRKGLPSSFVNRFVVVYADVFQEEDLLLIVRHNLPRLPVDTVRSTIRFVSALEHETVVRKTLGADGSPWELNLRDILRWLSISDARDPLLRSARIDDFLEMMISQRFRSPEDRLIVRKLFTEIFGRQPADRELYHNIDSSFAQVGVALLSRESDVSPTAFPGIDIVPRLAEIESVMICVKQNMPCILTGPSGSGKTALLQHVAAVAGKELVVFSLNADIDAMDLIGGFEQSDPMREVNMMLESLREELRLAILKSSEDLHKKGRVLELLFLLDMYRGERNELDKIFELVDAVNSCEIAPGSLPDTLKKLETALEQSLAPGNPRFEWLDGVIVKALERGDWLVLDNANLCSSAVLDRLNSLLEPNGTLSINEHSGPDGEPRLLRPHRDFRIFLTMDPRYGELSRAMRNRSVEVFIGGDHPPQHSWERRVVQPQAALSRFEMARKLLSQSHVGEVVDHRLSTLTVGTLSSGDMSHLSSFHRMLEDGKLSLYAPGRGTLSKHLELMATSTNSGRGSRISEAAEDLYRLLRGACESMTGETWGCDHSFETAQPLDTTLNAPLLAVGGDKIALDACWISTCREASFRVMEAREAMASEKSRSNISNLSTLNRFQRSSLSKKIPGAHKDSTSALAEFLDDAVESIERYIDCIGATVDSSQCWKRRKHLLRNVFLFLTRIFRSACVLPFNEAHFQAILSHGRRLLKTFHAEELGDHTRDLLKHIANLLDDSFVDGFTLTTGLCMEPLWAAFRPAVVADEKKFDQLVELETLANNFDALRWRIKASADELARFTRAFVDAYGSLRDRTTNDDGLIRTLSSEVASLELRIGHGTPEQLPFFSEQFEGLRQVLYLHLGDHNPQGIGNWWQAVVLANQPTSRELSFRSSRETTRNLYSVGYLMGDALKEHPWADQVSTSIVARLQAIPQANLLQLQSLEQELPLLGRLVTQHSEAIIGPHFAKLRRLLMQLLESVASASQEDLWQTLTSLYLRTANRGGVNSQVISSYATALELQADTRPSMDDGRSPPQPLDNDLAKAMLSLASDDATLSGNPRFLALAWIHFSVACVRLYVPDKIYDPQMAALAESSFLEELAAEIQRELEALQLFNYRLTGREQNTRVRLLEEELRTPLSQAPREAPTFYRPAASQLSALQAEFNNTIRTVLGSDIAHEVTRVFEDGSEASRQQLILVRNNIAHIVERLSARFRAYEDLTAPLINILQCLQLGLSLIPRPDEDFSSSELCAVVWSTTPFLGGKLATIDGLDNRSMPTDSLELLEIFGTVVSLEGIDSLKGPTRQSFFRCIHSFYKQWTRKLDADRKAEEAKRSLYRFKGSPEDEEEIDEEEFNQLFPTGDPSNAETRKPAKNLVRDVSVKLAMAHRQVVMSPKSAEESLRSLLLTATEITTKAGHSRLTESQILPGAMLALADCLESVQALTSSQNYSFYADVNLAETRRLASLVHRIQTRFRELQLAEEIGHHQILADVILACDKVLQAGHREPLALLISRVEQLHTHVYEWEFGGWAAKSYNAATLYEELTELLVSWRRLELSTWSRLFDAEMRACEDDANSWWFIAYQAVVVAPVSLIEEDRPDELSAYAVTLLSELETYFANALLGQFSTRLTLLKQLLRHVQMMRMDLPELSIIATGVQNFIDFYSHYEGPVAEAIQQGRKPLEKTMKDILLLASWRDTNIVALRESARRSHQKLFRIVKKFRAVLSRPASEVINQGLPEASHREQSRMFAAVSGQISPVDMSAIEICSTQLGWSESNKRLASLPTTLKRMANLGALPQHASLAATEISETMSSLVVAIDELRKETPSTLTEENGGHVKALKNRKQKLFASTLRDLRYMGFKDNLSTQILSGQDSLAKVMVHAGSFLDAEDSYLREVDDQLHHVLDLAPRVRAAAQEHSEDLTQAEVQRAVGLMEGMLHIILKQRRTLAGYLASLRKLQLAMMPLRALSATSEANGVERATTHSNCWRVLKWLPEVLQLGIHLVEIHGRLGNLKNADACDLLRRYRDQLRQLWHEEQQLPDLPLGFITARHLKNEKAIDDTLERLRADLRSLIEARPDLRFILEKLEDWTNPLVPTEIENTPHQSVESIVQPVSRFSDQILVAIQRYNRAASTLPTSTSNEKWLMGYDSAMALMLSELHMRQVSDKLELVVRDSCYSHTGAKGARLLQPVFAVLLPIVERYEQTCRNALAAYGELHLSVSKMAHNLSRIFVRLAAQGYCMPQEKSEETSGESGKLESGTGLGDGEGAQDISNDIQPDEDLSELSKEKNQERGEEIRGEKDAVDMDGEELEGDIASISEGEDDEEKDGEGPDAEGEEEGDIDEEVGDVDDLDPTAVDEKMWEGKDEDEAEKDQKGNKAKGETKPETGAGGEQEDVDGDDEGDMNQGDDDDGVADEEDAKDFEDLNRQDQNVQENDTLALPEEMELDMDANQESDSESSDDLDDLEDHGPEAEEKDEDQASEGSVDDINYDTRDPTHEDADDNDADEMDDLEPDEVDSMGDVEDAETQKNDEQSRTKEKSLDRTDAADGDAREDGQDNAQDQAAEQEDMDDAATSEKDEGNRGQGTSKQEEKDGDRGPQPASKHSTTEDLESGLKEQQETPVSNPFKKLGDVLEKWLRQTRDIKSAQQEQESQESAAEPRDVDLSEQQEFQHLSYDEAAADTQVLGAVPAEEEGRTWDDPMVLEDDEDSRPMQPDNADDEQLGEDNELETQPMDKEGIPADEARSGVQTRQGITERDETADGGDARETDEEEDIKETSSHLSATHISAPSSELPQSYSTALQLWTQYQTKTHALSLALTAQLRLILTPTQSTKLSGAFRTGKRLAIKRIIPYIASGYKRDKIWLRRAVPTKRAYQILVCVDDSLSMREHRAGPMALESLVMLARALAMLEVGQVGVLGFGKTVFAAHDLVGGGAGTVSPPLSSPDTGARALQHFSFAQDGTDLELLVRDVLSRFAAARASGPRQGPGGESLWQLALILSDGFAPYRTHAELRRLLRRATEERVMFVFIVLDSAAVRRGDSILDFKGARIVKDDQGNSTVVVERYLDSFPFQYYLIVHDIDQLPGALAGLLRTWFAEVNA